MKVITTPLAERYEGVIQASSQVFENMIVWEPNIKPVFDAFDEVKPDMVYCDIRYVNKTFMQACNEYPKIKIVLFADSVPRDFNPHLVCAQPSLSTLMKKHLEIGGHKTLYLRDSADVVTHWEGEADEKLSSDIAFISNGDEGSSPIQKLELFSCLSKCGRLKMVGESRIPLPQFIGGIPKNRMNAFLRSSKIAIDWEAENLLNQAANGIFTLTTTVNGLCPQLLPPGPELKDQISSYLDNEKARNKKARKAQRLVIASDTCYHRVLEITKALRLFDFTKKAMSKIEEMQKCVEE